MEGGSKIRFEPRNSYIRENDLVFEHQIFELQDSDIRDQHCRLVNSNHS